MKQKDLRELFFFNNSGSFRKRLSEIICYDEFKEIIISCVNNLNKNASEEYFKNKYDIYINSFKKNKLNRYLLLELDFFSKTTTNINYYLSRGWPEKESKNLLKDRQRVKFTEESKKQRAETFSSNYKKGKHKEFFRPSQIKYWKNKGYSNKDAKIKIFNYYSEKSKSFHNKRRKNNIEFLTVRQFKYWESRGLNLKDAQEQLRKIQDKRSSKYFIEKYGKIEGKRRFDQTTKKWLDTLNNKSEEEKLDILIRKTRRSKKYSNISIYLFDKILKEVKEKYNIVFKKVFYKEKEWYIYDKENKRIYFYDLMIKDINLIIEFNGNSFHPNKNILSEKEWNNWSNPITKQNANYHYDYDLNKRNLAIKNNYNYLIVWENETFEHNKNKIINKILSLYENRIN